MLVLLIDGLNLLRRIYAAVPGAEGDPEHAEAVLESSVRSLARALDEISPTHAVCALDAGGETWRHRLHPGYKATRPAMPAPLAALLPRIEGAFAERGVRSLRVAGFEADDVIASIAVKVSERGARVVVLSTDKSMLGLLERGVGVRNHFDDRDLDAAYVRERFGVEPGDLPTLLALVGDHSQGIPGVASIGAKGAAALVSEHGRLPGILGAATNMTGRIGEALRAGADDAALSLALVTPRTDVEIGSNLGAFRVASPASGPGGG